MARRFDRKAAMRETWLLENQRLVAQVKLRRQRKFVPQIRFYFGLINYTAGPLHTSLLSVGGEMLARKPVEMTLIKACQLQVKD